MIPPLPAYRRQEAATWARGVLTTIRDLAQVVLAHNQTAATRGALPVCGFEQLHGLVVRAKALAQQLLHAGKGTHTAGLLEEFENIWIKVHHLYQQVPSTKLTQRRK